MICDPWNLEEDSQDSSRENRTMEKKQAVPRSLSIITPHPGFFVSADSKGF
jgi:hypothetical protein